jgi:LacI family transcriptional regulator
MGLSIPRDLSVISFDDIVWFELTRPPITAVAQSTAEMGSLAARRVLTVLRDQRSVKEITRLPTRLIVRESCTKLQN